MSIERSDGASARSASTHCRSDFLPIRPFIMVLCTVIWEFSEAVMVSSLHTAYDVVVALRDLFYSRLRASKHVVAGSTSVFHLLSMPRLPLGHCYWSSL
jgi:hypothetical protein